MASEVRRLLQKVGWFPCALGRMKDWHRPASSPRRLITHSTGAELACLSSARLKACLVVCRPVNSGVRRLDSKGTNERTSNI